MTPKAITILLIGLLSVVAGALDQYYWSAGFERSPADWAYAIGGAILVFVWYRIDSKQRCYKTSPWLDIAVFGVAIIGLPYYFFRSRGAKSGLIASLLFLGAALGAGVVSLAGQYATYYALQA